MRMYMLLSAALALGACSSTFKPTWRGVEGDGKDFTVSCIDVNGYPSKREATDAVCRRDPIVAAK